MALGAAIAVDGNVDDTLAGATWVEVHERMGQPTTYRIRYEIEIDSGDIAMLTDPRLDPGSELSVLVQGKAGNECLVKGPVGSQRIHFEHGGAGSYVEVRGADSAIKMDREAKSTLWSDVTDSDAVNTIIGTYGFVPDVDITSAGHYENKHVLVQRESDLSFLRKLARRNGLLFWVTCDGSGIETAHFKKPPLGGNAAATLAINQTPPAFAFLDLRWDVERPTSVEGKQLDLNSGEDIDGGADSSPLEALGSSDLSALTGDKRSIFLAPPADDAGDLQGRAAGALVESYFFIRMTGETQLSVTGSPIRAHTVIEIQGAGSRHSGKYFVSGVRHTIDPISHRMELELLRNAWGA
jgi:phage protein D